MDGQPPAGVPLLGVLPILFVRIILDELALGLALLDGDEHIILLLERFQPLLALLLLGGRHLDDEEEMRRRRGAQPARLRGCGPMSVGERRESSTLGACLGVVFGRPTRQVCGELLARSLRVFVAALPRSRSQQHGGAGDTAGGWWRLRGDRPEGRHSAVLASNAASCRRPSCCHWFNQQSTGVQSTLISRVSLQPPHGQRQRKAAIK